MTGENLSPERRKALIDEVRRRAVRRRRHRRAAAGVVGIAVALGVGVPVALAAADGGRASTLHVVAPPASTTPTTVGSPSTLVAPNTSSAAPPQTSATSAPPTTLPETTLPATTLPPATAVTPVLGAAGAYPGGTGFGEVRPPEVYLGGDPTGAVSGIRWSSWGGPVAVGNGIANYEAPGQLVYQSRSAPAAVQATDLGTCNGHVAYQRIIWYFPEYGQTPTSPNIASVNACQR